MDIDLQKQLKRIKKRCQSENWHVRESAGYELRNLCETQFDEVIRATEHWVASRSPRVRRAVCLSCMLRKKYGDMHKIRVLKRRLKLIMKDDDVYVKKCCGPFVVGFLGYTYPDLMLPWLSKLALSANANIRLSVVKAFSQALGWRHPDVALKTLNALSSDSNLRISRTAHSIMLKLRKRLS